MKRFCIYDSSESMWFVSYTDFVTTRGCFAYHFYCTEFLTGVCKQFIRYTIPFGGGYYVELVDGKSVFCSIKKIFPKWDLRSILSCTAYSSGSGYSYLVG